MLIILKIMESCFSFDYEPYNSQSNSLTIIRILSFNEVFKGKTKNEPPKVTIPIKFK